MARSTIKDVAREAGVSVGSVSRVLNGLAVSARLKQQVNAAVARLRYEPNGLAQSMRTKSTGAVGCFVPDIANPLYGAIINAVDRCLRRHGLMLLLASARDRDELDVIAEFKRRRVDGLIFSPRSETDPQLLDALTRFGAPVVIQSMELPSRFHAVKVDYRSGIRAATDYLIGLGHRRIALLTPLAELWPGRERIAGFHEAFSKNLVDLSGATVSPQALALDPAHEVQALLRGSQPPTALILPGTRILAGALRAVRECQLRIPRDISLISIGDNEWVASHDPAITTLRWSVDNLAGALVELLLAQISAPERQPQQVTIPTDLVLRDSCGPAAVSEKPADDKQ